MSQANSERPQRWAPAEGDPSLKQVHALEFIAESLDRIEGHLDRIATSLAGSSLHKSVGESIGEQLRSLGDAIARMGRR